MDRELRNKPIREIVKRQLIVAGAVFIMAVSSGALPAAAQSMDNRINRLENEIQTLSRAIFKGDKRALNDWKKKLSSAKIESEGTGSARAELRISQLEMEIRSLTGMIEQQNFEIKQLRDNTDRLISDLSMRVSELESKISDENITEKIPSQAIPQGKVPAYSLSGVPQIGNKIGSNRNTPNLSNNNVQMDPLSPTAPAALPTISPTAGILGTMPKNDKTAIPPIAANTPTTTYEQAFSLLRDEKYEEAEKSFRDFLDRYPGHLLAANAKYWLGETFYVRKNYERAARIFAEAYQEFPRGAKAPDNLLKLGMSLAGMGKTEDACVALNQLKKEYKNVSSSILRRARQEKQRLSCNQ